MKDCCEILKEEHKVILKKLDELENSLDSFDKKKLNKTIDSIERDFTIHSLNKEEKVLFPVIEKFIPREGGPVGVMLLEHEDLDKSIKEFKKTSDKSKIREIGNHIISVLRDHISKEDNILFPMAHMHLDRKQNEEIVKAFEKVDKSYKK